MASARRRESHDDVSATLLFDVGGRRFGIPAASVIEIISMPAMARVPGAPAAILGIANVRGKVVPVISAARLLAAQDAEIGRVIVADVDGYVGFAVSSVSHIVDAEQAEAFDPFDAAALVAHAMPGDARRGSARKVAVPRSASRSAAKTVHLLTFAVGTQDYALPLSVIEQVLPLPASITQLPYADAAIVGSMAWRGGVLPLLSLAALLAVPVAAATRAARIVVVRMGAQRVGLVVDAMRSIVNVAETQIDPLPKALRRSGAEARVQAICRMDEGARLLSILSPEHLLRDDITASLHEIGDGGAAPEIAPMAAETAERCVFFSIGDERFGLPINAVLEITNLPASLSRLPKVPEFVRGVMNLRGKPLPLIDGARRFQSQPGSRAQERVIVVRIADLSAGLIVDEVAEIARIPSGAMRAVPDLGTQGARQFGQVVELSPADKPVLIVDPAALLDQIERDLVRQLDTTIANTAS